jgi:serine phosphatase RsbU (regulator of sigma subunit)
VAGLDISVVFEAAGEGIEVGGDLYDVLPTEDGCWVLIGDVAGKGSAAAGISVAVRHAVRGLTREIEEPEEVLSRVNELLLTGESLNDFATVMLARLRRADSGWNLVLASAGHPPAVYATGEEMTLLGGGSVLGAWQEAHVERHERPIGFDGALVLCTDGWLEAGPVSSHLGPESFAEMIQGLAGLELDEMTERLRADAVGRSAGTLRDDLVLLAIRPRAASDAAEAPRELASAPAD